MTFKEFIATINESQKKHNSVLTKKKLIEILKNVPDDAIIMTDFGEGLVELTADNIHYNSEQNQVEI